MRSFLFLQSRLWSRAIAVVGGSCAVLAVVAACGGGSGGSSGSPTASAPIVAPIPMTGTVATGAPLANATVTIRDASAATADIVTTTNAAGVYTVTDVRGLVFPLIVAATGTLNGEIVDLSAIVAQVVESGVIANATPITHAIAVLASPGGDPSALTSSTSIAALSTSAIAAATNLILGTLKSDPALRDLLGTGFDPVGSAFSANNTGIDAALDRIRIEVSVGTVNIINTTALIAPSVPSVAPVVITQAQVASPSPAPQLPASAPAGEFPTTGEMVALARKFQDCLAQPVAQRVTLNSEGRATTLSQACNFAPVSWKSGSQSWLNAVGNSIVRYDFLTGSTVGTPTIAAVLGAPNASGATFQHPVCNTSTCVVIDVPFTSASGRPWNATFQLGRVNGAWDFVGDQLPYSMSVVHRLQRYEAVNAALAQTSSDYFAKSRFQSALRLGFSPIETENPAIVNVKAVVWKGPGLPSAGVVTHRSSQCATADRFAITNQEGSLVVNNSTAPQLWTGSGSIEFILDLANLDGSPLAMPPPTAGWATTPSPANQTIRSAPLTEVIPAWSTYTAEIYHFGNNTNVPNEIVPVRSGTSYERASTGARLSWATLDSADIARYLTPTGSSAGSITVLGQPISFTQARDKYVDYAYLFATNRAQATNADGETEFYRKRGLQEFLPMAYGDTSMVSSRWNISTATSASLSPQSANAGQNPNPRCGNELVALEASNANASYRELALQTRLNRKPYNMVYFWQN